MSTHNLSSFIGGLTVGVGVCLCVCVNDAKCSEQVDRRAHHITVTHRSNGFCILIHALILIQCCALLVSCACFSLCILCSFTRLLHFLSRARAHTNLCRICWCVTILHIATAAHIRLWLYSVRSRRRLTRSSDCSQYKSESIYLFIYYRSMCTNHICFVNTSTFDLVLQK